MVLSAVSRLETCDLFFLCRMINYDPEEYKEATSMDFSIQHMHDGTAKLKCWSYSITRLIESKKGEALFT